MNLAILQRLSFCVCGFSLFCALYTGFTYKQADLQLQRLKKLKLILN